MLEGILGFPWKEKLNDPLLRGGIKGGGRLKRVFSEIRQRHSPPFTRPFHGEHRPRTLPPGRALLGFPWGKLAPAAKRTGD